MTAAKHPYPSNHRPGSHWATDEAWEILDRLPVGMLPDDYRFLTAGIIAGVLLRRTSQQRKALVAASHALHSYACGNSSTELAKEIAEFVDQEIAGCFPRRGIEPW